MGFKGTIKAKSEYNSYKEDIKDAYFKIESVFIDTERKKVRVHVRAWLSEYARHNQGIGVFKRIFYIPIEFFKTTRCTVDELTKKAYKYIAKLPEFADCDNSLKAYEGPLEISKEDVEKQAEDLEQLIEEIKNS